MTGRAGRRAVRLRRWLCDRYGTTEGFVNYAKSYLKHQLARRKFVVEWQRVGRLVFVCKGNICRSPFAEAAALKRGVLAVSYGIETTSGTMRDADAARMALGFGLSIEQHRSRSWSVEYVDESDLVLCMEPAQLQFIAPGVVARGAQVSLLGLYGRPPRPFIPDPYGASEAYFCRCFQRIDDAVAELTSRCLRSRECA